MTMSLACFSEATSTICLARSCASSRSAPTNHLAVLRSLYRAQLMHRCTLSDHKPARACHSDATNAFRQPVLTVMYSTDCHEAGRSCTLRRVNETRRHGGETW